MHLGGRSLVQARGHRQRRVRLMQAADIGRGDLASALGNGRAGLVYLGGEGVE